jgi:hypothetical protein
MFAVIEVEVVHSGIVIVNDRKAREESVYITSPGYGCWHRVETPEYSRSVLLNHLQVQIRFLGNPA